MEEAVVNEPPTASPTAATQAPDVHDTTPAVLVGLEEEGGESGEPEDSSGFSATYAAMAVGSGVAVAAVAVGGYMALGAGSKAAGGAAAGGAAAGGAAAGYAQ